jgi:membrane protein
MILALAFLMIVSLLVTTAVTALSQEIGSLLPKSLSKELLLACNFAVSFLVMALLFAALFKWLPDARIAWSDVAVGAMLTTALFMVGKFLLGIYLGAQDPSAYGPAAALVLILLWAYYSSMIVFFGGEFTAVWARRSGHPIVPSPHAVLVDAAGNAVDDATHASAPSLRSVETRTA